MPELNGASIAGWAGCMLLQPLLLFFICWSGTWRRWKSMAAFAAASTIKSPVLLFLYLNDDAAGYFYSYWCASALLSAIQLWALWEVLGEITGGRWKPILAAGLLGSFSACFAFASWIAVKTPAPFYLEIAWAVDVLDRSASLSWCLLFLIIAFCTGAAGLKWHTEGMAVTGGFAALTTVGTVVSWLLDLLGIHYARALSNLNSFGCIVVLGVWVAVFRRPRPTRIDESMIESMAEHATEMEEMCRISRAKNHA